MSVSNLVLTAGILQLVGMLWALTQLPEMEREEPFSFLTKALCVVIWPITLFWWIVLQSISVK